MSLDGRTLASPVYMLIGSRISWVVHLRVAAFCVQWLNCGCGALQRGRQLHCSHGRDSTVSSPSTQDVGLDLCNSKKKKKKNNLHGAHPLSPINQREQSSTSSHPPAFPGASLIRSHSGVQIWDGGPLLDLSSDCSQGDALTHLNTLSLLQHVSLSPYQWEIQHLGVIAWGHWSRSDPSADRDPEKGVRDEDRWYHNLPVTLRC